MKYFIKIIIIFFLDQSYINSEVKADILDDENLIPIEDKVSIVNTNVNTNVSHFDTYSQNIVKIFHIPIFNHLHIHSHYGHTEKKWH